MISPVSHRRPDTRTRALEGKRLILTRPLGATVGDFLDKPLNKGGLDLSRPLASLALTVAIIAIVAFTHRPTETKPQSA